MIEIILLIVLVVANMVIANWMLGRDERTGKPGSTAAGVYNRKLF